MAFGFLPKYQQEITNEGLSQEQILVLAVETIKALDWKLSYTSSTSVIGFTNFSLSSWCEEITVSIDGNTLSVKSQCTVNQLIDWGKNKKNILFFMSKFKYLKEKYSIEQLSDKFSELTISIPPNEEELLNQPLKSSKDKITNFHSIFIPKEGFVITPILIDLNIIVFVLMLMNGAGFIVPDNQVLMNWGGNYKPLTLDGQWWRLFTCTFIHAGVFHLLMNMYALLYIGLMLEPYLGRIRFLSFYILTGVAASTASLWWHSATISIGASGAIFGMYGIFLAMLTTNLIEKTARRSLLTSIVVFVAYNLLNGMKGGIDNAAHIGGLVSGILIGYGAYFSLKEEFDMELKIKTVGLSTIFVFVLSLIVYKTTPNNFAIYQKKMAEFVKLENQALQIFKIPVNDSTFIVKLLHEGIINWKHCQSIVDTIDYMNMPPLVVEKNFKIREYVLARIDVYNLLIKEYSGSSDTAEINKQIISKSKEIEKIVKLLTNK